jgi:hypothetical protein
MALGLAPSVVLKEQITVSDGAAVEAFDTVKPAIAANIANAVARNLGQDLNIGPQRARRLQVPFAFIP